MAALQPRDELEQWHREPDPWGYEAEPDDAQRKAVLLGALPQRSYQHTLDIGCGQGFVTRDLPGRSVLGVDVSEQAIAHARKLESERLRFSVGDIFTLHDQLAGQVFDLIVITGVLYPQYIGAAHTLVYHIIDRLLADDGILVSVHINDWYRCRFPYPLLSQYAYPYREYFHRLEVYAK
jgi:SAM-dependent methyltransferase